MRVTIGTLAVFLFLTGCEPDATNDQSTRSGSPFPGADFVPDLFDADIGIVRFPVSCTVQAAAAVERGVVLLHHMMYENARLVFGMAANLDRNCSMAVWGQAMTLIHPLWPDRPGPQLLARGRSLADRALQMEPGSAREAAYLTTTAAYFAGSPEESEQDRLARFATAWQAVAEAYPSDLEAQALFALAHLATAELSDKSYEKNLAAAEIAQRILEQYPDHPGAHHYLIHAYDNPVLAERALPVADRYGALTPAVPHATHMMTHIYTRLGLWRKSIDWNRRSADAAWEICVELGEVLSHYQHALDYLAYAHLQLGQDQRAMEIVRDIGDLKAPFGTLNPAAAAYAFAALPSRYHLERRDWVAASELGVRVPESFPWDDTHDPYIAIVHFARALGSARLGQLERADQEIASLEQLRDSVAESSAYWAGQIEIQLLAARAWTLLARDEPELARQRMLEAVALEAATEKSPVTPAEVLPASELLGDMLLELGEYQAALSAYQTSLERTPGRLLSLFGAARAAEEIQQIQTASRYYQAVLDALDESTERTTLREQAIRFLET